MNVEGSFEDVSENQCAMGLSCSSMTGSADASNCINRFDCSLAAIGTSYSQMGNSSGSETNDEQSQDTDEIICSRQISGAATMLSMELLSEAFDSDARQYCSDTDRWAMRPMPVFVKVLAACSLFSVGAVFGIMIHDGRIPLEAMENRDYSAFYFFAILGFVSSFTVFLIAVIKASLLR